MTRTRIALFAFATLCLLAVGACKGGSGSDKIIGKWGVDIDALQQMDQFKKMDESKRKMALEMAKGMMSQITFEITKDKFKVSGLGKTEDHGYTVKSADGNKVVIEVEDDDKPGAAPAPTGKDGAGAAKKGDGKKTKTVTIDVNGDKLVMHMGEEEEFPLKRK